MSWYRIGQAAEILGVSADTLRRWADAERLKVEWTPGGHRVIRGTELARFAKANATGVADEVGATQSARNRFPGIVTRVVKDRVTAQVEIQAGAYRVVSLMTREAADELGLRAGVAAIAVVKATNVVVEVAAG
jgi:molybdopterin-binding protein